MANKKAEVKQCMCSSPIEHFNVMTNLYDCALCRGALPAPKPACLYSGCEAVPICRAENPDYCPTGGHFEGEGECNPHPYGHKWICKVHWALLEFIRMAGGE